MTNDTPTPREGLSEEPVAWLFDFNGTPTLWRDPPDATLSHISNVKPLYLAPPRPSPAAGEGWKLVPVEPTDAMIEAAYRAQFLTAGSDRPSDDVEHLCWEAMVSASPTPPGGIEKLMGDPEDHAPGVCSALEGANLEEWIQRKFSGLGVATRPETEPPVDGEPFMSMNVAKDIVREYAGAFLVRSPTQTSEVGQLLELQKMLSALRYGEGSSVTFLSDNVDFNGQPNNAIECCGFWTDWKDRRFTGETIHAAVVAAYEALSAPTANGPPSAQASPTTDAARWGIWDADGTFINSTATETAAWASWKGRGALVRPLYLHPASPRPVEASDGGTEAGRAGLDLDALEKVARGATQRPWSWVEHSEPMPMRCLAPGILIIDNSPGCGGPWGDVIDKGNAAHIATFDPPTVLALIAALRAPTRPVADAGEDAGLRRRLDRHIAWGVAARDHAEDMLSDDPFVRAAGEGWWRQTLNEPKVVSSAPPHVAQTPGDISRAQSKPSDPASQDLAEENRRLREALERADTDLRWLEVDERSCNTASNVARAGREAISQALEGGK